jgi:hypothetical protein
MERGARFAGYWSLSCLYSQSYSDVFSCPCRPSVCLSRNRLRISYQNHFLEQWPCLEQLASRHRQGAKLPGIRRAWGLFRRKTWSLTPYPGTNQPVIRPRPFRSQLYCRRVWVVSMCLLHKLIANLFPKKIIPCIPRPSDNYDNLTFHH